MVLGGEVVAALWGTGLPQVNSGLLESTTSKFTSASLSFCTMVGESDAQEVQAGNFMQCYGLGKTTDS